jgi:triosephosphate isomerase
MENATKEERDVDLEFSKNEDMLKSLEERMLAESNSAVRAALEVIYGAMVNTNKIGGRVFIAIETKEGHLVGGGGLGPLGTLKLNSLVEAQLERYTKQTVSDMLNGLIPTGDD